jgi:hypothetical protein
MQQQAAKDVTKAQWVLLFKESNALWHAVVLAFREVLSEVQHPMTGEDMGARAV